MSKRKALILLGIFGILAGLGGLGILLGQREQRKEPLIKPTGESVEIERKVKEALYEDESGFSFKYPEDTEVKDVTPDEETYYSKLAIKNKEEEGVVILIKDTVFKTVDEWFEKDEELAGEGDLTGAVALAEMPAKQYAFQGKVWTAAIDRGVLYLIEGVEDKGFWEKIYDRLIRSFTLVRPEKTEGENVIYESEEIIE